ncbi:MAG: GNAT family N-acetyltransferase [Planctomycetes bacterium]|nr:GNAT family N-acetyltransferase [Planctomycetota bacterium]
MTVHREWRRGEYVLDTDPERLDLTVIHGWLAGPYWSPGMPRATVERAVAISLCFGVRRGEAQVGFARVVTDFATFAWVCDVFVLEVERGRGLASWMIECMRATPELQGLRRWILATRDAHAVYARHGFTSLAAPERWMDVRAPSDLYSRGT